MSFFFIKCERTFYQHNIGSTYGISLAKSIIKNKVLQKNLDFIFIRFLKSNFCVIVYPEFPQYVSRN